MPRPVMKRPSKCEDLQRILRKRIVSGELPSQSLFPSQNELAAMYGVSHITVREALGVLAHEGLLTRIQGKGTFVTDRKFWTGGRTAAPKNVAIVFIGEFASATNIYFAAAYHALCACLCPFDVAIKTFQFNSFDECEKMASVKPGACVVFTFKDVEDGDLSFFKANGIPAILINRSAPGVSSVNMNNEESSFAVTEALIGKGHKRIIAFHLEQMTSTSRERMSGYVKAMDKHGLPPMPLSVSGWQPDSAVAALSGLAGRGVDFTAVICEGVFLLQGAKHWLDLNLGGLQHGVAIACLDNWGGAFGDLLHADVLVETPLREMGLKAGELLLAMLDGSAHAATNIVVPAKLVVK